MAKMTNRKIDPRNRLVSKLEESSSFFALLKNTLESNSVFKEDIDNSINNIQEMIAIINEADRDKLILIVEHAQRNKLL